MSKGCLSPEENRGVYREWYAQGPRYLFRAVATLKKAGFNRVRWRPFFVPRTRRVPSVLMKALAWGEDVPLLPGLALRWKFHCLLLGEP